MSDIPDSLIDKLRHPNPQVRQAAMEAVGRDESISATSKVTTDDLAAAEKGVRQKIGRALREAIQNPEQPFECPDEVKQYGNQAVTLGFPVTESRWNPLTPKLQEKAQEHALSWSVVEDTRTMLSIHRQVEVTGQLSDLVGFIEGARATIREHWGLEEPNRQPPQQGRSKPPVR